MRLAYYCSNKICKQVAGAADLGPLILGYIFEGCSDELCVIILLCLFATWKL